MQVMNLDKAFKPMEDYIPKNLWNDLMYMHETDGIYHYKHKDTRYYINVDEKGRFYDGNKIIRKETAIKKLHADYELEL